MMKARTLFVLLVFLMVAPALRPAYGIPCAPTNTPTNTPTHTPTNTPTNTPTETPTHTPTPKTTPPSALWQFTDWPSEGVGDVTDDVDVVSVWQCPLRVFWSRHTGDQFGWVVRRSIGTSSPTFLPITPTPLCIDASGTVQTPAPWGTPPHYWYFGITDATREEGEQQYYQLDALSDICCYDFNTTYTSPYNYAERDLSSGPNDMYVL